ncbi:MAG: Serine/threonine protein kinase [Actinomycetia bacterium]|nr:Serine/threonine protein kinase [Actinomycetes bacterium]
MLAPGTRLAAYEVRERLAVGGMGEVYLCRHRLLDRIDAVKVLRPHLARDDAFRRRFLREALSAARLRHPHLVTVYTADEIDGQLYLAMEYVPGADLGAILARDGALPPARAITLLSQVADALDAAHRHSLTHRDVKPSNVLVERPGLPDEHAYLVDFGLSKSDGLAQDITMMGQILGTTAYISPEQLKGLAAGPRSDQYSLGCMAFEALSGRLPFPRDEQLAVLHAHLNQDPGSLREIRPSLPAGVDAIVARAMAKSPADRFDTCTAFVHALRDAVAPPAVMAAPVAASVAAAPAVVPDRRSSVYGTAPVRGSAVVTGRASALPAVLAAEQEIRPAGPNLCLAVVGGPDGGRVAPLPNGEHVVGRSRGDLPPGAVSIVLADPHLRASHLSLRVHGWSVRVEPAAPGTVLVDGEPADGPWELRAGQVIEAGSSLLEVRAFARLAGDDPEPDPVTLGRLVHDAGPGLARSPQESRFLSIRVGWQAGQPPVPLSVPFGGTASVALRGKSKLTTPLLRWILAQAIGLHSPADLAIAAAIVPSAPDPLAWLSAAPHARPWTPLLSGRHVVNSPSEASSLVGELRELIEVRRIAAARGSEHRTLAVVPRILAVLDDRLGVPGVDYLCTAGPPLGVHVVRLVRSSERAPASCSICVDVDRSGREVVIHLAGRPGEAWSATPDGVSLPYARDLTDALTT